MRGLIPLTSCLLLIAGATGAVAQTIADRLTDAQPDSRANGKRKVRLGDSHPR